MLSVLAGKIKKSELRLDAALVPCSDDCLVIRKNTATQEDGQLVSSYTQLEGSNDERK